MTFEESLGARITCGSSFPTTAVAPFCAHQQPSDPVLSGGFFPAGAASASGYSRFSAGMLSSCHTFRQHQAQVAVMTATQPTALSARRSKASRPT